MIAVIAMIAIITRTNVHRNDGFENAGLRRAVALIVLLQSLRVLLLKLV